MHKSNALTTVATYGLLVLACLASFMLPRTLLVSTVSAQSGPDEYTLMGLVRDFQSSHPDFNVVPDQGYGHYAGNVGELLPAASRRPIFVGGGARIDAEWLDSENRPIAPHMAGVRAGSTKFDSLGIRVNGAIHLKKDGMIDGFNSTNGPYGIMGNYGADALVTTNSTANDAIKLDSGAYIRGDVAVGPGGNPQQVIDGQGIITGSRTVLDEAYAMPDLDLPSDLQPWIDVVEYTGSVTLSGDTNPDDDVDVPAMHVGQMFFRKDSIITIQGDLRIMCDTRLELDGTQITLLPEAVLSFTVSGNVEIKGDTLLNTNPGDTTAVTINVLGAGNDVNIHNRSHVAATVVVPQGELHLNNEAQFYGAFLGESLRIDEKAGMHVDGANADTSPVNFAITVQDKIEIADNTILDGFDSTLGAYGAGNMGSVALLTTNSTKDDKIKIHNNSIVNGDVLVGPGGDVNKVVDVDGSSSINGSVGTMATLAQIPVVTPPALGVSVGDVTYDGGTYDLDADLRCQHLTLVNGAVLNVSGNRIVRCDDKLEMKGGSEIRLLPGATLTIYVKKDVKMDEASMLNANTGNPQLVSIRRMRLSKKGKIDVKNGSVLAAWIQGGTKTDLHVHAGEFHGSFIGKKATIHAGSTMHVDMAYLSSCTPNNDTAGLAGAPSSEAISSPDTFNEWFSDGLGINQAAAHEITLVRDTDGVYEYLSSSFHPIDGMLFGNEAQPHNNYYTYSIAAEFAYEECSGQFVEFQGGDGAWLFINGHLVLDLGGVSPATSQFVDLDRLGLADGQVCNMHLFYADRSSITAVFRLRTNLELTSSNLPTINAMFD